MKTIFPILYFPLNDIVRSIDFDSFSSANNNIKRKIEEPLFTKQQLLAKNTGLSEQSISIIFTNAGSDTLTEEQITNQAKKLCETDAFGANNSYKNQRIFSNIDALNGVDNITHNKESNTVEWSNVGANSNSLDSKKSMIDQVDPINKDTSQGKELSPEEMTDKASWFTVKLSHGSGVVLKKEDNPDSDGVTVYIATNKHVTNGNKETEFEHPKSNMKSTAKVIYESKDKDIAFVKVVLPKEQADNLLAAPTSKFTPAGKFTLGDDVSLYGFPGQTDNLPPDEYHLDQNNKGAVLASAGRGDNYLSGYHNSETGEIRRNNDKSIWISPSEPDPTKTIYTENASSLGYKIMYDDYLLKGQSGGATLNLYGEVVGLNGYNSIDKHTFRDDENEMRAAAEGDIRLEYGSSRSIPIEEVIQEFEENLNIKL